MTKRTGARTGGQILVDQLRIQGCDRIFTVPGESFLAVLDALHDAPEIDTIVCRQEGGVSLYGRCRRQDDRPARRRLRHPRPRRDQCLRRSPCRLPGFDPDDPVRRRPRPRRPRPRGLPGNRHRGLLRADLQMGGADRRCSPHPRICRPRLPRRDRRPPRPGGARTARGHAARRGRGARPPARRRRSPKPPDPGAIEAMFEPAEGRDQPRRDHRRRRLEPARRASFRQLRLPPRHSRPPPPSAARTRSATTAASMPASSATAPTPSCSSASARPTCCSSSAPASARRRPTATS